ncbi:MAG: ribonuclease HIII [Bacilli bacterium]|nr:ribonuclease HIII [Bacilli bacterium]
MKENVTITVDATLIEVMRDYYQSSIVNNMGEYIDFQAEHNDVIITAFLTKKERKKVTFFGEKALEEARVWDPNVELNEKKEEVKEGWIFFDDQIGSDEVGVGDFLGPMIVVAAFVSKKDIKRLIELGIHDSKKMKDEKILEVGPTLVKEFKFSKLTLPNEKYNEMYLKGENLNSMKAKMHNRALNNMHKQYEDVLNIFVDQFVSPNTYYKYLNDTNEEIVKDIIFKTKGESYFPCVALASVIARYSYLLEMKKLEEKYHMTFPFGASKKVTVFAKEFLAKYGEEELNKIVKKNFANYNEVVSK